MSKVLYIGYPKCSTCKKASNWLDSNHIEYDARHIVTENPSQQELKGWIEKSGFDIKKFFNSSGLKYKELNLKDKLETMTDDEKIELLSTDGMLVKRPLVIGAEFVLLGFREEQWKKSFQI